ncbi:MAG: hypothetical protein H7249_17855 [Chitinophagaceae bacterium]|nr:hypothetical protein [Oligoflexus sp.]
MTHKYISGSTAGLLATAPMTIVMAAVRKGGGGLDAPLPPEEVATRSPLPLT